MASKSASPKTTTPWGHLSQMDTHLGAIDQPRFKTVETRIATEDLSDAQ